MEGERTPGTPDAGSGTPALEEEQDGASAAIEDDGSDPEQNEVERLRRVNAQLLSEKENRESRQAALDQREQELRERESRLTNASNQGQGSQSESQLAQMREDYAQLQLLAQSTDPSTRAVARTQLMSLEIQFQNHREAMYKAELNTVPEAHRDAVDKMIRSGEVGTIALAMEIVELRNGKAGKLAGDAAKDAERRRAEAIRDATPAGPGVTRNVGAREAQARRMPRTEFRSQVDSYDQTDPVEWEKRAKLLRDKRDGKIVLTD